MPMKNENPKINFVLKLFRLQNWRKPKPAEAAHNVMLLLTHVTIHFVLTGEKNIEHDVRIMGSQSEIDIHTNIAEEHTVQSCYNW